MIHLSLFEGSSSGDITKTGHGTLVIVLWLVIRRYYQDSCDQIPPVVV